MAKNVRRIPTLQEYARKRRIKQAEFLDLQSCHDCDYYRNDVKVCIFGGNVRNLTSIKTCPVTQRVL